MPTIDYILRAATDWAFRRRSPALLLVRAGVALIVAALGGGWLINIAIDSDRGSAVVGVDTESINSWLTFLQTVAFALGFMLVVSGAGWEVIRQRQETARLQRRKVIVIEQRGLRASVDSPLTDALPNTIEGLRDPLIVDIRERIKDGVITSPEVALERIVSLSRDLETRIGGRDRSDIEIVYGGLLPVPFTFLTGMLLDDEGRITVFDWDRDHDTWRQLDAVDDGERFQPAVHAASIDTECILALSISYQVDLAAIARTFPNLPLLHLQLEHRSSNCHWSMEKQVALASEFLNAVKDLGARGATRIHLIIAAPNSMVFRLGRIYDKRNLPDAVIYQYERSNNPAYPWGVRLPTHGLERAQIVQIDLRT